jgi:hypothetical protein
MRWTSKLASMAVLASVVTACGVPIQSGTYRSPSAQLDRGLTFAWNEESDRETGDSRLEGNRFFEERLHEAIEWELALRGIHPAEGGAPDLRIHHHLTLEDHDYAADVVDESGVSSTEVYTIEEGNVVVHLVDADSGETLWIGWGQANVEPALTSPANMSDWVYALVREIFDDWAVPGR